MDLASRVESLLSAPKARWALAWLAAADHDEPRPADFHDAATVKLRTTRLHRLRDSPEALLAEIHTRVEDWRHQVHLHHLVDALGPADGYRRIAEALAQSEAAAWWWQPVQRHAQTWIGVAPEIRHLDVIRGLPFDTNYAHGRNATAPAATLETSTRLGLLPATALLSDQNLPKPLRTSPDLLSAWSVTISDEARIAEVHNPQDWSELVDRFVSHRTDLCHATHLQDTWPAGSLVWTIDWREMARHYDGLHLSVAGWLTSTSVAIDVPGRGHTLCEGWPTERSLWFGPKALTGEFRRIDVPGLEYGYGRPATGARFDLGRQPAPRKPWWRRPWRWAQLRQR